MFNKNINNNQKKPFLQKLHALLFLFLLTSCEDHGCIDADDFGEYETYTFRVESSRANEYCAYKKDYKPVDQPLGIKDCIRACEIIDSCILGCEDKCRLEIDKTLQFMGEDNQTYDTLWTSIGGEKQVSIEHNSKILITAQGKVTLGNEMQKSTVYIDKNHTGKEDWKGLRTSGRPAMDSANIAKFSGKENINITIEGEFKDKGILHLGKRTNPKEDTTLDYNLINYYEQKIANGARRLFAYFIPFPQTGEYDDYKFPLAPDPSTWQCSIEGEGASSYYSCSHDDYCNDNTELDDNKCDTYNTDNIFITDPKDQFKYNRYFSKVFNVDNLSKKTSRYDSGTGFIRYKGDGFQGTDSDLNVEKELNVEKKLLIVSVGKSGELIFPNNQTDYAIKFKDVSGEAHCSDFQYKIVKDDGTEDIYKVLKGTTYVINKGDLDKIWYSAGNTNTCKINVYFYPFQELEFEQSGYIEFGIPTKSKPTGEVNCNLKFKIFHKNTQKDEFANFTYPSLTPSTKYRDAVETNTADHSITNGTKKYFIRKGQILSFHPDSWNGTWTPKYPDTSPSTPTVPQECGVGFYVKLTPRPAVFCSNKLVNEFININQDDNSDTKCVPFFNEEKGIDTGCQEEILECQKLCPNECIPRDFSSCRADTSTTDSEALYKPTIKANCIPENPEKKCYPNGSVPLTCINCITYRDFSNIEPYSKMDPIPDFTESSCESCIEKLKNQATKQFYKETDIALQQCYDLENYTGTMEELKNKLTTSLDGVSAYQIFEDLKAKGLKKLETFNGNYGNFYPLKDTKQKNTNDFSIYQIEKLASIGKPGYVKFIILDDISMGSPNPDYFEKEDTTTAAREVIATSYLRVNISSNNELSNGEGLTIALCKENSDGGRDCSLNNELDVQKQKFNNATEYVLPITEYVEDGSFSNESNYRFNDFGQLIRQKEIGSSLSYEPKYQRECTSKENMPYTGANFLCFKDNFNEDETDPANSNKYRLTFKIFDKETPSCKGSGNDFVDCVPTDENCDKFKIYNPTWNGEINDKNYCTSSENQLECEKKFKCTSDKYVNNEGHYDVAVRIRKDSKVKVSNFIDSIISPILGQVDGFYNNKIEIYTQPSIEFKNDIGEIVKPDVPSATPGIEAIISKDPKMISSEFKPHPSLDGTLKPFELNPNKKDDPNCKENCYISYITKAQLLYNSNCRFNKFDVSSYIKYSCLGYTKCSFLVSNKILKYFNGEEEIASAPQDCNIVNFYVEYIYSKSEKPLYKENQVRRIYKSILINPVYKSFLTLSIVLMLSFYGMGFLMGVSELKQSEIVDRLIKIAIIYLFTNPDFGWVWFEKFFVTFFKNGVDFLTFTMAGLFDETNQIELALKTSNFSNKSLIFGGVDRVVQLFLINDIIHKKIGALMFYNFFGILYVMIIYYSAIAYVYAISNAVLIYLTSQFFTSVLFLVGPIFFVFILFKQTKGFFDNWLNALIGFGLQQIFLIFTLSLFNTMLYMVIKLTLGYKVCWDSVWNINAAGFNISLLSFWTPQDFPPYLGEISNPTAEGSTVNIPTIPRLLSLWTICVIMKSFITTITDLAASLSGGMSATELGSSVAKGMDSIVAQTQKKFGDLYKKSGAQLIEIADQKLFNSGALAKKTREKEKNDNSNNNKLKSKMNKDGDKAVSDYKVKNANEYAKMSEADKRKTLNEVKLGAMKDSAKSMGKTDKEAEALMKDKSGSKYQGDNVFGAMMSIGKDRFKNSFKGDSTPTGRRSLNEKALDFNTGMSSKEMKKAIKGMDDSDKRQEFIGNVKEGNIKGDKNDQTPLKQERKEAVKELEKSGAIGTRNLNLFGYNSTSVKNPFIQRSEGSEDKIIDKIKENRENKSDGGGKASDTRKLEAFTKYLEVKEGKNSKEDQLEAKKGLLDASKDEDK